MCARRKLHPNKKNILHKPPVGQRLLPILFFFLFALSLRLIYLYQIIPTPLFHGLVLDTEKYTSYALKISKGIFTHPESIYLNPLYPFFLASVYLLCGYSQLAVLFIQAIIDSISCALLYYFTTTLFNPLAGTLAALMYSLYGPLIFYSGLLLAPSLVIFLSLLYVILLQSQEKKGSLTIFFLAGILFGLTVSAQPTSLLFIIFLPFWLLTRVKKALGTEKTIKVLLFFLTGFGLVMFLCALRNYAIIKTFTPFAVHGGINFYIGNNPQATGQFMSPDGISQSPIDQVKTSIAYAERELGRSLNPSEASRYWMSRGFTFIKNNPTHALGLFLKKLALFWRAEEIPLNIDYVLCKQFAPLLQLPLFSFGFVSPFALLGILVSIQNTSTSLLPLLYIISHMLSVISFFVSARYRLPAVPFLIMYAAYGICSLGRAIKRKKIKELVFASPVLLLLFLGINLPLTPFTYAPSPQHFNNLGSVYDKLNLPDKAIAEFNKALNLNPQYAEAYYNLGNAYFKKGMLDQAIEEYKKALTINPKLAEAHNNLGRTYGKKGMLDDAMVEFINAIDDNPLCAEAYFNLGTAYGKKMQIDEAIEYFKKAIEINPEYAEAYYNLGLSFKMKGMEKEARAQFEKAVSLQPDLARFVSK